MAGARQGSVVYARVPPVVTLFLPTMTSSSASDSFSILKDGKLKPGIYKIQSVRTDTYLDAEVYKREVCCRPAKDLGEGRGLVSWYWPSAAHTSDNLQWEIKQFGAGYTVQRVSLPISFKSTQPRPPHVNAVECRSTRENLNSFVPH